MKLGVASSWGMPRLLSWKSTTFNWLGSIAKLFPFLFQISFTIFQGFQKRFFYFWKVSKNDDWNMAIVSLPTEMCTTTYRILAIIRPSWIEPKGLSVMSLRRFFFAKIKKEVLKINIRGSYNSEHTVFIIFFHFFMISDTLKTVLLHQ